MNSQNAPKCREEVNHARAWFCSIRNRYFPYLRASKKGLLASLLCALLVTILASIPYVNREPIVIYGVTLTGARIFFLIFGINIIYILIREFAAQGILFPDKKEIDRILNRKFLTAAKIDESLAFVKASAFIGEGVLWEYRRGILDLIKSNLESYFEVKPDDKKRRFSVSLIEVISKDQIYYKVVARDSLTSAHRSNEEVKGDSALLWRPVEAIQEMRIVITDDLDLQYSELKSKDYKSVLAIPILWLDRQNTGRVEKRCFAAICIDFTEPYRFRGIGNLIESNIRPYYRLLLYSYLDRLSHSTALEGEVRNVNNATA